jgi:hypothetical protein
VTAFLRRDSVSGRERRRDFLATRIFTVAVASQVSIEAMALSATTAIEGLTKDMGIEVPPEDRVSADDRSKALEFFAQSDWNETRVKRLKDLVNGLDAATAKSRLYQLAGRAVITDVEIRAWGEMRNKLAHGALPEFGQEMITNAHRVLTLFHKLVLHCIGFRGKLRDYGQLGWPLVECGESTTHHD